MTMRGGAGSYRITTGDGRSTEELVEAGEYAYAHSCVTSENFPARHFDGRQAREIILVPFDHDVTSEEAIAEATQLGFERPTYEDALYFGIEYPDVQREHPVVFLHDPWFGFFGRRDVLCLWTNAGRRELGLEGFDDRWIRNSCFAFVRTHHGAGQAKAAAGSGQPQRQQGPQPHRPRTAGRLPDGPEGLDGGGAAPRGPAAPGGAAARRSGPVQQAHGVLAVIAGDPAAFIQEPLLLPARRLAIARVDHFDVLPLGVCRHDVALPLGRDGPWRKSHRTWRDDLRSVTF